MENKKIYRAFRSNSLWRDAMISRVEADGSKVHYVQLDNDDFDRALRRKILEEADEVVTAQSVDELTHELADVLEVIHAFCNLHNISFDHIMEKRLTKRAERGGFENRTFVLVVEHEEGSAGELYCRARKEKYPEVKQCC